MTAFDAIRAYDLGRLAAMEGWDESANPYDDDRAQWWLDGWRSWR